VADVVPPLPRELEADPNAARLRARLERDAAPLWPGAVDRAPRLAFDDALAAALGEVRRSGELVVGLEAAAAALDAEARGLDALASRGVATASPRVSRLLLVADDGAERFYRQVERLTRRHAPRVLTCRLAAPAVRLGAAALGRPAPVKAVLVQRKGAVARVLRALAEAA
jgi:hypothetical protein